MSNYTILLSRKARRILDSLSDQIVASIHSAIVSLEKNPRPVGCKKLKGRDAYRIRRGKYRIIYEIIDDKLLIHIITIGHRRDIYKNI
jgi:mRNA interferase RelE/StbE